MLWPLYPTKNLCTSWRGVAGREASRFLFCYATLSLSFPPQIHLAVQSSSK